MKTDYNPIAAHYKKSKLQPWRTYIEQNTLLELVGSLHDHAVIDLACGEGHYTRQLKQRGASRTLGVDLSEGMIALAESQEQRRPLGIEYLASDACDIDFPEQFDLAFAAYLTCYAASEWELLRIAESIYNCLKPGGRFVTVTNEPDDPAENFSVDKHYGFQKAVRGALVEGTPIDWTFEVPDGSFTITNYHLERATIERVFKRVGFSDLEWHTARLAREGVEAFGEDYWHAFMQAPPVTFLTCRK